MPSRAASEWTSAKSTEHTGSSDCHNDRLRCKCTESDHHRSVATRRKCPHRRKPCTTVRALVRQRIGELDERLAELKRYRPELAKTLEGAGRTELDGLPVASAPGSVLGATLAYA